MKLIQLAQCKNTLNFRPMKSWPAHLPVLVFQNERLSGFDDTASVGVEIESDPHSIFHEIYPTLSLSEWARVRQCLKHTSVLSLEVLTKIYGVRMSEDWCSLLDLIIELPLPLQNWISERDFGGRELSILRLLNKERMQSGWVIDFMTHLSKSKATRVEAARILELGIELFLKAKVPERELLPRPNEAAPHWLRRLECFRYPETTKRDTEKQNGLARIAWPTKTQARFTRQGDISQLEIKVTVTSSEELKKKISDLLVLQPELESLWK